MHLITSFAKKFELCIVHLFENIMLQTIKYINYFIINIILSNIEHF